MIKYTKGQVGIVRHPNLYTGEDYVPVFKDVETELLMWKAAEKFSKIINKGKFDWRQMMFIMHYTMNLQGMNDDDMYMFHAWQQFKISQSVAGQKTLEVIGSSARQLVENQIANDPDIEIVLDEQKKPKLPKKAPIKTIDDALKEMKNDKRT